MRWLDRLLGRDPLIEAMRAGSKQNSWENRKAFHQALLDATVLALATPQSPESFAVMNNPEAPGKRFLLAFTDEAALKRGKFGTETVKRVTGRELLKAALGAEIDEIHVNPLGPVGASVVSGEFRLILDGMAIQDQAGKGFKMDVGGALQLCPPTQAEWSAEILGALTAAMRSLPAIDSAYHVGLLSGVDGRAQKLVQVIFIDGTPDSAKQPVFESLLASMQGQLKDRDTIDFMEVKRSKQFPGIEPFYRQGMD